MEYMKMKADEADMVNKPPHDNKGKIETKDDNVDALGEWEAVS